MTQWSNIILSDFDVICRTCLLKKTELVEFSWASGLMEWPCESPSLEDVLRNLVFEDESDLQNNLPSKICLHCTQQLFFINQFLQACKEAQVILKNILNEHMNKDVDSYNYISGGDDQNYTDFGTQNTTLASAQNIAKFGEKMSFQEDGNTTEQVKNEDHEAYVISSNIDSADQCGIEEENNYDIQLEDNSMNDYMDSSGFNIVELNEDNLTEMENGTDQTELLQENYENEDFSNIDDETIDVPEESDGEEIKQEIDDTDFFNISPEDLEIITKEKVDVDSYTGYEDMSNVKDFDGNVIIYEKEDSEIEEENDIEVEFEGHLSSSENSESDQPEETEQTEIEGLCYMCSTCDLPFASYKNLMEHKRKLGHNLEQIFVCPECQKKFYSYLVFFNHFNSHLYDSNDEYEDMEDTRLVDMHLNTKNRKPYTCKLCNIGLVSEEKLKEHTEKIHNSVICEKCFTTVRSYKLEDHKVTCSQKDSLSILVCKKCPGKFSSEKLLYEHITKEHSAHIFSKCTVCGFSCMSQKHVETHMNKFHRDKRCPQCGKVFQLTHSLTVHMAKMHKDKQKLICEHCGKKFVWGSSLKQHVKNHHQDPPAYHCQPCNKTFTTKKLYTYHQFRHQVVTPFECPHCDKAFNNRENLTTHLKSHAQQTGAHRCVTCDKSFFVADNLKRHLVRVHGFDERLLNV